MNYKISFESGAKRQLNKLPESIQIRIVRQVYKLRENPRPPGVKKLKGNRQYYRIRVGDYRIMYRIRDDVLIVLIVKVAHRKEAY